jgi:hypothetical protein
VNRFASSFAFGLALVASFGLAGCEKDPPVVAEPSTGEVAPPPVEVVVEQPGAAPAPAPADPEDNPDPALGTTKIVVTDVACQTDADCVKSTCCHATSCGAAADAPDCSASICTMDCQAGTMDCNGGCVCQAGKCAAQLWFAPQ